MAKIFPFKALSPSPHVACLVAAPPYDVVTRSEALTLADGNPINFLRVSRSEIEFSADVDPYSDQVYERAQSNFERLRTEAPLNLDSNESFYIYSLSMNGHRQTGLAAAASVDDYDNDRIKKHELTRKVKEDDRTRHTMALRAHTGPVFLTYRSQKVIDDIVANAMNNRPLIDITTDDGIQHQIWRISHELNASITRLLADVNFLYVADGHHRAKSASRVREICRKQNPEHTGNEAYNRFLSVIFPHEQLKILPYNRVVRDLNGLTAPAFLDNVEARFELQQTSETTPRCKGNLHMYLDDTWYRLIPRESTSEKSVVDSLDVSILQNSILEPILGITDPRTNTRVEFIGGVHGTNKLETLVNSGKAAVAFSLFPVGVNDIINISDAGKIMPPKSTWFEPKLRDGLLCHCF